MASTDVFVLDVIPTPVHVEPVGRLQKGGAGDTEHGDKERGTQRQGTRSEEHRDREHGTREWGTRRLACA